MTTEQLIDGILNLLPARSGQLGIMRQNLQNLGRAELERRHAELLRVAKRSNTVAAPAAAKYEALKTEAAEFAQMREEGLRGLGAVCDQIQSATAKPAASTPGKPASRGGQKTHPKNLEDIFLL